MTKFVIDISSHQSGIDIAKVAAQCDGVMIRIGRTYYGSQAEDDDDCFEGWYKYLKSIKKPVGCYYYSCADNDQEVKEETTLLLKLLAGKSFELGVWMDEEDSVNQRPLSTAELTRLTKSWLDIVAKAGYGVGLYASYSWLLSEVDASLIDYPFWIARYNTTLGDTKDWNVAMWQYTSGGRIDGWAGNLDFNHCYMDLASATVVKPTAVQTQAPSSNKGKPSQFVKVIQNTLNVLGYRDKNGNKLKVDGYAQTLTESAVKKFQAEMKLPETGLVDTITRAAIDQIMGRPLVTAETSPKLPYATRYVQKVVGTGIDGDFGPKTDKAVRAYQEKHGLDPDAEVGPKSWAVIL